MEKQRKASSDREIRVFAISICLQVERINRDCINILRKERRLFTGFVRKHYRHSNYVCSYKIFLFFRAPSICDNQRLIFTTGSIFSVTIFVFQFPPVIRRLVWAFGGSATFVRSTS